MTMEIGGDLPMSVPFAMDGTHEEVYAVELDTGTGQYVLLMMSLMVLVAPPPLQLELYSINTAYTQVPSAYISADSNKLGDIALPDDGGAVRPT